jgi:hypothetical protein
MSSIKSVLEEEYVRLKKLKSRYAKDISALPVGSLSIKNRNSKEYAYIAYRKNGKVKTDYIGSADSEEVYILQEKIKNRKKLELLLKTTNDQLKEIDKVLHGRKI